MERERGETDAGWFQRLASQQRAMAGIWYRMGEVNLGVACDELAVVYQEVCEMYQETRLTGSV